MKILYSLNSGTPGGMEQHVLYLVKGMVKKGHEVHVWCKSGEIYSWFEQAGAHVTSADIKIDIDPTYVSALSHYLKDNSIDVVHSHELKAVVNSLLAAHKAGTEVNITHTHTPISEWPSSGVITKIKIKLQAVFYAHYVNKYSSCEIALTKSRERVKTKEGIKPKKIKVIPNCFNFESFNSSDEQREDYRREIRIRYGIPEDALVFGNVSRLSEEKNQEFLIKAFSELKLGKSAKVFLLIAGGGKLESKLRNLIKATGLEERIIITGVFSQSDLPKFYYASDVFVFPSKAEGFGLVLIESLAAALPVLASDLEVLREVGDDTIDYFPLKETSSLTKMLNGFIKYFSENGVIPLNLKGQERVKNLYTEEAFISAYENLYKGFLNK